MRTPFFEIVDLMSEYTSRKNEVRMHKIHNGFNKSSREKGVKWNDSNKCMDIMSFQKYSIPCREGP